MNRFFALISFILIMFPACAFAQAFEFQLTSKVSEHHKDKVGEGAKTEIKTKEESSIIIFEPEKISVRTGNNEKIYDFDKKTLTFIAHDKKQFTETSLYAIPAFKDFEKRNREMLLGAMQNAGITAVQSTPFELEAIFGDNSKTEAGQKIQTIEHTGGYKFLYDGEDVTAYAVSDQAIRDELKDSYKKYLIYEHTIHPAILENMAGRNIFNSLSYRNKQEVPFLTEKNFTVSAFNNAPSSTIAVPQDYQKNYGFDERLDKVIKMSLTEKEKTVDDYAAEMNKLLEDKQYLEASLVFHEYATHTGGKDIDKIKAIIQRIFSEAPAEEGVQQLAAAISQPPSSKEHLQKAIEIIEAVRSKNTPHSYVLNIYLANYVDVLGQTAKAQDLILEALEKNPFIAGAYKDLGDKYFKSFHMQDAWTSWNQMRSINTGYPLATPVNELEMQILEKHPVYF